VADLQEGLPGTEIEDCLARLEAVLEALDHDNALAETISGLFKTEVIHRQGPWRGFEDVEFATLNWVWWFNHHRLLEPIGYIPPVEHEEAYWRKRADKPLLAPLK